MTDHTPQHESNRDGTGSELPAELAAIASALDGLGADDGAAANEGFEARVFAGSFAALTGRESAGVAPVAAALEDLGSHERAAGAASLEASAFELSREAISSGRDLDAPVLRLVNGPVRTSASARVVVGNAAWIRRGLRVAAAIVLAGGAVAMFMVFRGGGGSDAPDRSVELAENFEAEWDSLLEVIQTGATDPAKDQQNMDRELDGSWLDEMFSQETL